MVPNDFHVELSASDLDRLEAYDQALALDPDQPEARPPDHCGRGDAAQWSKIYSAVGPQVSGVRRFGSAALDLAWVAAGRFDGFWEDDLDVWDTAAGVLLVKAAGGFVTDYRGSDRSFERREYIAGSSGIHSKLQKLVAGALRS